MKQVPKVETVVLPEQQSATHPVEGILELFVDAVREYAIFMLDPAGMVVTWNTGAQRIKGYTADEIIGQHFSTFYIPDDVAAGKPQRELAEAIANGQCRDEGWRLRKDGTRFWANVVITAIIAGDGQLEGFAKITRDDTDRKWADERVRELELATDRERIAAGLHDSIVHRIFEAGLEIQGTLQLVSDPTAVVRIRAAVELLDETLKEIRTVVLDLNSSRGVTPL